MFSPLQKRIQNLPSDIQNIIISYTYSPQEKNILEDIRNYKETKEYLYEIIEEVETAQIYYLTSAKDEIHNELCNFIYYYLCDGSIEMINIYFWRRYFMYKYITDQKISHIVIDLISNYSIDCQINILWGFLIPEERNTFLDLYTTEYAELFEEEEDQDE